MIMGGLVGIYMYFFSVWLWFEKQISASLLIEWDVSYWIDVKYLAHCTDIAYS